MFCETPERVVQEIEEYKTRSITLGGSLRTKVIVIEELLRHLKKSRQKEGNLVTTYVSHNLIKLVFVQ